MKTEAKREGSIEHSAEDSKEHRGAVLCSCIYRDVWGMGLLFIFIRKRRWSAIKALVAGITDGMSNNLRDVKR